MIIGLRGVTAFLAAFLLIAVTQTAYSCDLTDGIPCDKVEEIHKFRVKFFEDVRGAMKGASAEARAKALVEGVGELKQAHIDTRAAYLPAEHFDYSNLPDGTKLLGVEFDYDTEFEGDREIRILLDLPASFLKSKNFNARKVASIGAEFMGALVSEDFNRYFLYAKDPSTGEVVDIQELLPEEVPAQQSREVDYTAVEIAKSLGKNPERNTRSLVPTINPGQPSGALSGKTIYINQSHGWFDDYTVVNRYRVQRGDNFGILEDFDSAEFINAYVLPVLRNAGAKVQTVRESDFQTNMVIVDNADTAYAETGTWSNSTLNGFKQKTGASWNGVTVNPFDQGSGENRLSSGLTTGTPTATATWTATIPEDGYYNVYASWAAFSSRASDAQYQVYHSGGVSDVRVDQTIDGYTWNLLGNWYFEAGAPASERKVVLTNNSSDTGASNVSADAVRWGGGMGDVARHTNGVSGRPRWEEEAVLYLQFNGFGYSGTLYGGNDDESGGWSDRPQYARWEHSQKDGSVEDGIYLAWHTNAFNGSARGLSTFRHSTATQASTDLQVIMHDLMYDHIEGQFFPGWTVRSKNGTNFGENNQSSLGTGLPGFLIEGLFHDNATDAGATGYGSPEFRYGYARAIRDGLLAYFEDRDSITLTRAPETPTNLRVTMSGTTATIAWDAPPDNSGSNQYLGDAATSYVLYQGTNGFGFDDGTAVSGTSTTVSSIPSGSATFFRVAAVNSGGQSFPTETLAAASGSGKTIIVNGFDRNTAALVPKESITNAGTDLQRLDPRNFQAFNYSVEHALALAKTDVEISSASNEAVIDNDVTLSSYDAVFWLCGEESTGEETFSSTEQSRVSSYLASGDKALFVSGSEIGWDLGRSSQPQADQDFYEDVLRSSYGGDDAGTYNIAATSTGPFAGLAAFDFNPANGARYDAEFPDIVNAINGSAVALDYSGGADAAVYYDSSDKVISLGFPFELISSASIRDSIMADVVDFFGLGADTTAPAAPTGLSATAGDGEVALDWNNNSEGDLDGYNVYRSTTSGSGYTKLNGSVVSASAYTDSAATNGTTYYYVVTAVDTSANESGNSGEASATPQAAPVDEAIVDDDDGSPDYTTTGGWTTSGSSGYNGGAYQFATAGASATATWEANVPTAETYEISLQFRASTNRATNAQFEVASNTGTWIRSVDQTQNNLTWVSIGHFPFNSGDISVTLNAAASSGGSVVIADAVRFTRISADTTAPSAPGSLSATPGDGSVSLDWADSSATDFGGYNVYRSTTSGSGYTKLNGSLLSSSDFVDSGVTNFTTYYYVVTAVDTSLNESTNSTEDSAQPQDTTAPAAPTGLSATAGDGEVALDWNNNSEGDLDGYNVYRSTTSGSGYTKLNGSVVSTSAYTDSAATNGTTYYYVVTAVDDTPNANESGNSGEASATPQDITAPSAPVGLGATAGNGEVDLAWSNNSEGDLDGYNVYRSTTSGSGYTKLNGSIVSASAYTDSAATNGTTYYYVVTAVDNSANESANSSQVSATPANPVPANALDLDSFTIGSYGSQDVNSSSYELQDDGYTMRLFGNTWKTVDLNYSVTANTVIEFDYKSTGTEPEIGGIVFDNDTSLSSGQTWKVYGTQNYGITTYDNYTGSDWVHYTIPVGQTLTAGSYQYLVLMNDMDSGSGTNSFIRNIEVYESQYVVDNDDGSPDYTTSGSWFTSGGSGYNGGGYQYATTGASGTSAVWNLNIPTDGSWLVEVQYRASGNRSPNANFDVARSGGTDAEFVDQTSNNLVWVTLGTYTFDANGGTVTLDAADSTGGGVVIADAVRLTKQ